MNFLELLGSLLLIGAITATQFDAGEETEQAAKRQLARLQLIQIGKALRADEFSTGKIMTEHDFGPWLIARLHGLTDARNTNDPWGTPLKYENLRSRFRLTSAGSDCEFFTEDDLVYE